MKLLTKPCGGTGILLCGLFASSLWAQNEIAGGDHVEKWLEVGVDYRFRGELESFQRSGYKEVLRGEFSRARLGFQAYPTSWLRFAIQLQDARVVSGRKEMEGVFQENYLDLEYGYAEVGGEGGRWRVRAGRQPLAFGDERLIGADAAWDNRSQAYDGVRVTVKRRGWKWDVFSATPAVVIPKELDRFNSPGRLSGVYGSWSRGKTQIEPYVLWIREPGVHSELWTAGVRVAREWTDHIDSIGEAALQQGESSGLPVRAWAGYMEGGYRTGHTEGDPRISAAFSYGSGDRNAGDGRSGTFNDLHPSVRNGCDFAEPFSWRNIRDLRLAAEWTGPGKWRMRAEGHSYWLATTRDGLYVDEGPYVLFDPAARGSRLGSRVMLMMRHALGDHMEVSGGFGKFWATEYLKECLTVSHGAFVAWRLRL